MEKVNIRYTGERVAPMRYIIKPNGGVPLFAQGYVFHSQLVASVYKSEADALLSPTHSNVMGLQDGDKWELVGGESSVEYETEAKPKAVRAQKRKKEPK